ncbi:transposase, partial [Oceanobacillus alkalisoli]|uniref:transposase n=1 Tax=Oceanobacillus alkalisoli TaxID=2925113 RepID=UPI003F68B805
GKRKIDVEPVFGFLKANLGFTRFSVRGKQKATNELAFALMAVNLRKFTAKNSKKINNDDKFLSKMNPSRILMTWILFLLFLASYVPASFFSFL